MVDGGKRRRSFTVTLALVGVMGALVAADLISSGSASISAEAYKSIRLDDSYFTQTGCATLLFDEPAGEKYLRRNLSVCPPEAFQVERVTDTVYSVRFERKAFTEDLTLRLKSPTPYLSDQKFTLAATEAWTDKSLQTRLIEPAVFDNTAVDRPLLLVFSDLISESVLQEELSLSGLDGWQLSCRNNLAVIQPDPPMQYDTDYQLLVNQTMTGAGGKGLAQAYRSRLHTALPPASTHADAAGAVPAMAQPSGELTVETLLDAGGVVSIDGSITLIFSDDISEDTLRQHLTLTTAPIYSEVPYIVTCKQNVAVLRPANLLTYHTIYQITISEGLTAIAGSRLEKAFSFSFESEDAAFSLVVLNQDAHSTPVGSPIRLEYELENQLAEQTILEVAVYRFNNYKQYLTALTIDEISDSFHLTEISTQSLILKNGKNSVSLESPDGSGFFLVKSTYVDPKVNQTRSLYKCVNLVGLSVYLQTVDGETTLWVNNVETGTPAADYKAEFSQRKNGAVLAAATTDAQGIASLTYAFPEEMDRETLLTIFDPQGNPAYLDTTQAFGDNEYTYRSQNERYYSFFFLDRALYHPTDTVNFWGFVKPRAANRFPMPASVSVVFDPDGLKQTVEAVIQPDGTFSGQLSLEQIKSSQYEVSAMCYSRPPMRRARRKRRRRRRSWTSFGWR